MINPVRSKSLQNSADLPDPNRTSNRINRQKYVKGFAFSLALTLVAYFLVWRAQDRHFIYGDNWLIAIVAVVAIIQLFVQLVYFLHLGQESKPRWNLAVFSFAALIVVIVIFGSLWIMNNLNYHHNSYGVTHDGHTLTSPQQTNQYIFHDEGVNH